MLVYPRGTPALSPLHWVEKGLIRRQTAPLPLGRRDPHIVINIPIVKRNYTFKFVTIVVQVKYSKNIVVFSFYIWCGTVYAKLLSDYTQNTRAPVLNIKSSSTKRTNNLYRDHNSKLQCLLTFSLILLQGPISL